MVKGAIASNINISFSMPGGKGYELRQVSGKIDPPSQVVKIE